MTTDSLLTADNNVITGTDSGEVLVGTSESDTIYALGGMDTLLGMEGDDSLYGGDDSDTLLGGSGSDTLVGGSGNDVLMGDGWYGDPYSDTFSFAFTVTTSVETESFTSWLVANGYGGYVDSTSGELADGTAQNVFSTHYTAWLNYLVGKYSLGVDLNGDGRIEVGLNQNDPSGTPVIEGLSAEELAAIFDDRDNVLIKTGKTTHERWYSNTFETAGGEVAVASSDGHDLILDFQRGVDKLYLGGLQGLSQDDFYRLFDVREVNTFNGGELPGSFSSLCLADGSWSVTLMGYQNLSEYDFFKDMVVFG